MGRQGGVASTWPRTLDKTIELSSRQARHMRHVISVHTTRQMRAQRQHTRSNDRIALAACDEFSTRIQVFSTRIQSSTQGVTTA